MADKTINNESIMPISRSDFIDVSRVIPLKLIASFLPLKFYLITRQLTEVCAIVVHVL